MVVLLIPAPPACQGWILKQDLGSLTHLYPVSDEGSVGQTFQPNEQLWMNFNTEAWDIWIQLALYSLEHWTQLLFYTLGLWPGSDSTASDSELDLYSLGLWTWYRFCSLWLWTWVGFYSLELWTCLRLYSLAHWTWSGLNSLELWTHFQISSLGCGSSVVKVLATTGRLWIQILAPTICLGFNKCTSLMIKCKCTAWDSGFDSDRTTWGTEQLVTW